jgi:hypothetical protein
VRAWHDLAPQLGVARGTAQTAYEKLAAAQLIEASSDWHSRRPAPSHRRKDRAAAGRGLVHEDLSGDDAGTCALADGDTGNRDLSCDLVRADSRARGSCRGECPLLSLILARRARTEAGNRELSRRRSGHHLLAIAGHYHWRLQRRARPSAQRSGAGKRPGSRPRASRGPERDLSSHACPSLRSQLIPTVSISITACATILTPGSSS